MVPCGQSAKLRWLLLLALHVSSQPAFAWNVLVLGGTGFRGHPTTEHLARLGHKVTVVSRGSSRWDVLERLRKVKVKHWECTRTIEVDDEVGKLNTMDSGLAACAPMIKDRQHFDAVIDFSSSSLDELKQAFQVLQGRMGFYIFMSSHEVYMVSKNATHGQPVSFETDAVRPGQEVSFADREALKLKTQKGNVDLECEEELDRQYKDGGVPFTSLRLADVIGPRENTMKFWLLQLWIRAHQELKAPLHVVETLSDKPISFTYTLDIARVVVHVLEKATNETCCPEHVQGEAFNVASEETPSQRSLYNKIAGQMDFASVQTTTKLYDDSITLYPQIVRGPVNVEKATKAFKFSFTDTSKAVRSLTMWYDRKMIDPKFKAQQDLIYMLVELTFGKDASKLTTWLRDLYAEMRKSEVFDELDDEDEDEILGMSEKEARRQRGRKKRQRRSASDKKSDL